MVSPFIRKVTLSYKAKRSAYVVYYLYTPVNTEELPARELTYVCLIGIPAAGRDTKSR